MRGRGMLSAMSAMLLMWMSLLSPASTMPPNSLAAQPRNLDTEAAYKRVCYYTNWSQYRPRGGRFLPSSIDPFICTHIIFAFAKLDYNGHLAPYEWNDIEYPHLYRQFNSLKRKNPALKTLLAVGGWTMGSSSFSKMVKTKEGRQSFVEHAIKYLRTHGFDGLDLDWEYPANRGSPPEDRDNFSFLLKDLHEAFVEEGMTTGQPRLLLAAAVAGGEKIVKTAYDVPVLNKYLDFISLMSYDLHGSWSKSLGHNAPLFGGNFNPAEGKLTNSVDDSVKLWLRLGTSREKLVMGIPFYGRSFTTCGDNVKPGQKNCGVGRAAPYTREKGFVSYYEMQKFLQTGWKRVWLDKEKVPYAYNLDTQQWVGYDDVESLKFKAEYIREEGLGGAMFWALDLDDFSAMQSEVSYPLASTVRSLLAGGSLAPVLKKKEKKKPTSNSKLQRRKLASLPTTPKPPAHLTRRIPNPKDNVGSLLDSLIIRRQQKNTETSKDGLKNRNTISTDRTNKNTNKHLKSMRSFPRRKQNDAKKMQIIKHVVNPRKLTSQQESAKKQKLYTQSPKYPHSNMPHILGRDTSVIKKSTTKPIPTSKSTTTRSHVKTTPSPTTSLVEEDPVRPVKSTLDKSSQSPFYKIRNQNDGESGHAMTKSEKITARTVNHKEDKSRNKFADRGSTDSVIKPNSSPKSVFNPYLKFKPLFLTPGSRTITITPVTSSTISPGAKLRRAKPSSQRHRLHTDRTSSKTTQKAATITTNTDTTLSKQTRKSSLVHVEAKVNPRLRPTAQTVTRWWEKKARKPTVVSTVIPIKQNTSRDTGVIVELPQTNHSQFSPPSYTVDRHSSRDVRTNTNKMSHFYRSRTSDHQKTPPKKEENKSKSSLFQKRNEAKSKSTVKATAKTRAPPSSHVPTTSTPASSSRTTSTAPTTMATSKSVKAAKKKSVRNRWFFKPITVFSKTQRSPSIRYRKMKAENKPVTKRTGSSTTTVSSPPTRSYPKSPFTKSTGITSRPRYNRRQDDGKTSNVKKMHGKEIMKSASNAPSTVTVTPKREVNAHIPSSPKHSKSPFVKVQTIEKKASKQSLDTKALSSDTKSRTSVQRGKGTVRGQNQRNQGSMQSLQIKDIARERNSMAKNQRQLTTQKSISASRVSPSFKEFKPRDGRRDRRKKIRKESIFTKIPKRKLTLRPNDRRTSVVSFPSTAKTTTTTSSSTTSSIMITTSTTIPTAKDTPKARWWERGTRKTTAKNLHRSDAKAETMTPLPTQKPSVKSRAPTTTSTQSHHDLTRTAPTTAAVSTHSPSTILKLTSKVPTDVTFYQHGRNLTLRVYQELLRSTTAARDRKGDTKEITKSPAMNTQTISTDTDDKPVTSTIEDFTRNWQKATKLNNKQSRDSKSKSTGKPARHTLTTERVSHSSISMKTSIAPGLNLRTTNASPQLAASGAAEQSFANEMLRPLMKLVSAEKQSSRAHQASRSFDSLAIKTLRRQEDGNPRTQSKVLHGPSLQDITKGDFTQKTQPRYISLNKDGESDTQQRWWNKKTNQGSNGWGGRQTNAGPVQSESEEFPWRQEKWMAFPLVSAEEEKNSDKDCDEDEKDQQFEASGKQAENMRAEKEVTYEVRQPGPSESVKPVAMNKTPVQSHQPVHQSDVSDNTARQEFKCPAAFGIFADPENCGRFYQCVWLVALPHDCGAGTIWNDAMKVCDWPKDSGSPSCRS